MSMNNMLATFPVANQAPFYGGAIPTVPALPFYPLNFTGSGSNNPNIFMPSNNFLAGTNPNSDATMTMLVSLLSQLLTQMNTPSANTGNVNSTNTHAPEKTSSTLNSNTGNTSLNELITQLENLVSDENNTGNASATTKPVSATSTPNVNGGNTTSNVKEVPTALKTETQNTDAATTVDTNAETTNANPEFNLLYEAFKFFGLRGLGDAMFPNSATVPEDPQAQGIQDLTGLVRLGHLIVTGEII